MCNYIPLKISARLNTPSMHGDATFFHQYFYGDIPTGKCFMETKSLSILQVPCIEMLTIFTHRYSKDVVGMCMSCRGKDSRCKTLHGLLIKITATRKQQIQKAAYHLLQASIITCLLFFYHNRARNLRGIHCNLTATEPETKGSPAVILQQTTYHFPKHDSNRSGNLIRITCLIFFSNIHVARNLYIPSPSQSLGWLHHLRV